MNQAQIIMDYIESEYKNKAEYLFIDSDTAVFRKGERKKWYAVVMTISRRKLGIDSDEMVEVLNVKLNPNEITLLIDKVAYFPAYHMNKKHWCTIPLDGTLDTDEICFRVNESYSLVKG